MIPGLGIFTRTILFIGLVYLTWKGIRRHTKVYFIILFNAVFLVAVFWLFSTLKN